MEKRTPDFNNVIKLMERKVPDRPTLFELFLNMPLYEAANGYKLQGNDELSVTRYTVDAFKKLGYDYASVRASKMLFTRIDSQGKSTISLNDGAFISDEESFEKFEWADPDAYDKDLLFDLAPYVPEGMKLMIIGPGGILENAISLVGYDNLCFMMFDEPELTARIFDEIGRRTYRYYELALEHDEVGLMCINDDWGFNTATFLSPAQMKEYVFPWTRKMVELGHRKGKKVLLHSCGNMRDVIDDIIDMGFDAKHSYEDVIFPIEKAYDAWHDRIALLGGIDMNFLCTRSVEEVAKRTRALIDQTAKTGGWAVGTGNSVPEYIPVPQYMAMREEALKGY